jgi:hypothetical protein
MLFLAWCTQQLRQFEVNKTIHLQVIEDRHRQGDRLRLYLLSLLLLLLLLLQVMRVHHRARWMTSLMVSS